MLGQRSRRHHPRHHPPRRSECARRSNRSRDRPHRRVRLDSRTVADSVTFRLYRHNVTSRNNPGQVVFLIVLAV
jgi:hypothetical protein